LFPADVGDGHFIGVVRVLDRVCAKANLTEVTPHVLRHTFASVAGDLGFSELTIAGLLGHAARGVTQGYVHLDAALAVAADRVSAEIAKLLDGESKSVPRPASPRRKGGRVSADAAASRRPSADDGDLRSQLVSV
jgi:integrase